MSLLSLFILAIFAQREVKCLKLTNINITLLTDQLESTKTLLTNQLELTKTLFINQLDSTKTSILISYES